MFGLLYFVLTHAPNQYDENYVCSILTGISQIHYKYNTNSNVELQVVKEDGQPPGSNIPQHPFKPIPGWCWCWFLCHYVIAICVVENIRTYLNILPNQSQDTTVICNKRELIYSQDTVFGSFAQIYRIEIENVLILTNVILAQNLL